MKRFKEGICKSGLTNSIEGKEQVTPLPAKLNLFIDDKLIGECTPFTLEFKNGYTVEVYRDGIQIYEGMFEAVTVKSKWYQFWKWFN